MSNFSNFWSSCWYWAGSAGVVGGGTAAHRPRRRRRSERCPLSAVTCWRRSGATGTIEPEEVVDVGAQVAGLIDYFGKDPAAPGKFVDYRTEVDQGTVLAHIDESLYKADADQAQSLVDQANANVDRARPTWFR